MTIVLALIFVLILVWYHKRQRSYFTPEQAKALGAHHISAMTPIQIAALSPAYMPVFTAAQLAGLTEAQMPAFTKAQSAVFTPEQIAVLKVSLMTFETFGAIVPVNIPFINTKEFSLLDGNKLQTLGPEKISKLTPQQFNSLSNMQFTHLVDDQRAALSSEIISALSPAFIANNGVGWIRHRSDAAAIVANWTPEQYGAIPLVDFSRNMMGQYVPTPAQIAALQTDRYQYLWINNWKISNFDMLKPEDYAKLGIGDALSLLTYAKQDTITPAQYTNFPATIFNSEALSQMGIYMDPVGQLMERDPLLPPSIALLSPAQFASIIPASIAVMPPAIFAHATPAQIAAMTTAQIQALTPDQIAVQNL